MDPILSPGVHQPLRRANPKLMSLLQLFVYDSGDNFRTTDKVYLLSRLVEVYKANPYAKLCRTLCLYHKTRHAPPFPSLIFKALPISLDMSNN